MPASGDEALIATFNRAYFSLPSFQKTVGVCVEQLHHPPTHCDLMILFISMQELELEIGNVSSNRPHIALRCMCVCTACVCLYMGAFKYL